MNLLFRWTLKTLALSAIFLAGYVNAQNAISPYPENASYLVKPDYRKCAFPLCGGWFLTPLNQFSHQLETEEEAYESSFYEPAAIYVAYMNYRRLGLTDEQTKELEAQMRAGQALLRGTVTRSSVSTQADIQRAATFYADGAWVSANKREAYGPYLKVSSSGIVCITTPCPYYKAKLINTRFETNFDDLNLEKAELDRQQTAQAWQAVATEGLVMTGVKYEFKGMTGTGTGVAATKVFFTFPSKSIKN